jgi:hypothetical protein
MNQPEEDLAIDLAGVLIAPTFPSHKTKKKKGDWFRYWEKQLTKAIKRHIRTYPLRPKRK